MENLSLTFCLVIVALLASVGSGFAFFNEPRDACIQNAQKCTYAELCSSRILGKRGEFGFSYPDHAKRAKKAGLNCVPKSTYPKRNVKPTVLGTAFIKLSKSERKQLQSNLKDLRFYKSLIDGLYGKGTAGALTAYNKKHLGGSNLKKSENVEKLIYAVLALKTSPKPKTETAPVPIAKAPTQNDDTYKVASGTGFYVSDTGHIITNHHVIDGCKDMKVHSKGNVLETTKISEDRRNDLALLKTTESPKHSFALSMESPFPLQDIVVAGFPLNRPGFTGDPEVRILGYGNVVAVAVAKMSLKKILQSFQRIPILVSKRQQFET